MGIQIASKLKEIYLGATPVPSSLPKTIKVNWLSQEDADKKIKDKDQKLLNKEQEKINDLTSKGEVNLTQPLEKDFIKPKDNKQFDLNVAVNYKVDFADFDTSKFSYMYYFESDFGIMIVPKLKVKSEKQNFWSRSNTQRDINRLDRLFSQCSSDYLKKFETYFESSKDFSVIDDKLKNLKGSYSSRNVKKLFAASSITGIKFPKRPYGIDIKLIAPYRINTSNKKVYYIGIIFNSHNHSNRIMFSVIYKLYWFIHFEFLQTYLLKFISLFNYFSVLMKKYYIGLLFLFF